MFKIAKVFIPGRQNFGEPLLKVKFYFKIRRSITPGRENIYLLFKMNEAIASPKNKTDNTIEEMNKLFSMPRFVL